jgi:perosamine synthetase
MKRSGSDLPKQVASDMQRVATIPVNEPLLTERDLAYVTECVQTGWISSAGRFIDEFEAKWAAYCERRYGIAVSNGTTALQLAVACLNLEAGDEVIMPSFTIISCAMAVVSNGGVPVLVDSDPRTWCMDVAQLERRITPRTRAIMPVHMYGHPVDMDPLLELADRHGLAVIEDAAEAHGAEYLAGRHTDRPHWRRCGSFGAASCFSFYANKLITTGEGGMIVTDRLDVAEKARSLRNLCFQPARRFHHTELGFNFRLTNLQAALGVSQLERMADIVARKRWIGAEYQRRLSDIPCLQLPAEEAWARSVYWMYGIVIADEISMDAGALAQALQVRGVETRPFFLGMHEQPVFHERQLFRTEQYPVAERLARRGLYLPSGLTLTTTQLDHVSAALHEVLR